MDLKKELRKKLKEKRNSMSQEDLQTRSRILCRKLLNHPAYQNAETVFCYLSFGSEIDTGPVIEETLQSGRTLCVPVITGSGIMTASRLENLSDLVTTRYGIREPSDAVPVAVENIDLCIVPALAFTHEGYRIGYGGGFYDRFLDQFKGISAGLVLREFLLESLPVESFDRRVSLLITED
jgi:5-formyltetrahydrofolate cyclo-ligase